jgi:hypothetical protein
MGVTLKDSLPLCEVLSYASDPSNPADAALFMEGDKVALLLIDGNGERTWHEKKIAEFWNAAQDQGLMAIALSYNHYQDAWHWFDFDWSSLPAMDVNQETHMVEIWFKGYSPTSELYGHITRRRKENEGSN